MTDRSPARLSSLQLFAGLPDAALNAFAKHCVWQTYQRNEEILSRNSDSRDVYSIAEGHVRVVNYSLTGREIAYATLGPGEFFGELAAIDHQPRSSNIVAAEKSVLVSLPPAAFEQLILAHPEVGMRVLKKLAAAIRQTDQRIMDMSTMSAHQRLFAELLRCCEPDPLKQGRWQIYPMPTQQAFASLIGTTRETVARALGELTASDIVHRKGKTLYIDDRDRLHELIEALSD